jgi:hypothetical protein
LGFAWANSRNCAVQFCPNPETPCMFPICSLNTCLFQSWHCTVNCLLEDKIEGQSHVIPLVLAKAMLNQSTANWPLGIWMGLSATLSQRLGVVCYVALLYQILVSNTATFFLMFYFKSLFFGYTTHFGSETVWWCFFTYELLVPPLALPSCLIRVYFVSLPKVL